MVLCVALDSMTSSQIFDMNYLDMKGATGYHFLLLKNKYFGGVWHNNTKVTDIAFGAIYPAVYLKETITGNNLRFQILCRRI